MVESRRVVAYHALIILLLFTYPVVGLFVVFFVFNFYGSRWWLPLASGAYLSIVFSWINSNKDLSGDWYRYVANYIYLEDLSLADYFGVEVFDVVARSSEPVYHFIASVLSKASGANVTLLAVVVTSIIYFSIVFGVVYLNRFYRYANWKVFLVAVSVGLLGITFTLTTHLVRQEMAIAFLVLALSFLLCNKIALCLIFGLLAAFTHSSSIVLLFNLIAVWFGLRLVGGLKYFALIALILSNVVFSIFFIGGGVGQQFDGRDDGAVSYLVFLFDISILLSVFFVFCFDKERRSLYKFYFVSLFSYMVFLLLCFAEPLAFLRMYFYIELFRVFGVAFIVYYLCSFSFGALPVFSLVVLGCFYVHFRVLNSPFDYGGDFFDYLFYSFLFV